MLSFVFFILRFCYLCLVAAFLFYLYLGIFALRKYVMYHGYLTTAISGLRGYSETNNDKQ